MPKTAPLSIRELRANLKHHLDNGATVAIGDAYQLRALLVSLPPHDRWDHAAKKKALSLAKISFLAALKALDS